MTIQHKREPYGYSDSDYVDFTQDVEQFLTDDRSLPDRPDHLIAQQAATGAAYRATFVAMNAALGLRKQASDTIENTVKLLKKKLNWMKTVLPTLSDESILLSFGLDKSVPVAYSEIKAMADAADVYWQTVALYTLYVPFADGCNDLADLITIYDSARATQVAADGEYSQRQNEKDLAREAHHEVERDIFTIYTGTYPDPYDDYWTNTPWGKASGGSSDEGGGEENAWPNPLASLKAEINELGHISVSADAQTGAAKYNFYVVEYPIGENIDERPAESTWTGVPIPSIMDTEHEPGTVKKYWACGVNDDGLEGEFCEPVSVEIMSN